MLLEENLQGNSYRLLNQSANAFELLIPAEVGIHKSYAYQKGTFEKNRGGNWSFQSQPLFQSIDAVVEMTKLSGSDLIASTAASDGWQYAYFGVMRTDSLLNPIWKQTIYDKKNPYDPRVPPFYVINDTANELITHYAVANDTIAVSYLSAFDLESGEVKWQKVFMIPADFTEYFRMDYDEDFIYIVGESHMTIRQFFWQPTFHAGMVCKIDRRNGDLISFKHFGNADFNAHTRISDLIVTDSTLQLFGTEDTGEFLFSEEEYHFMWEIVKEDI